MNIIRKIAALKLQQQFLPDPVPEFQVRRLVRRLGLSMTSEHVTAASPHGTLVLIWLKIQLLRLQSHMDATKHAEVFDQSEQALYPGPPLAHAHEAVRLLLLFLKKKKNCTSD